MKKIIARLYGKSFRKAIAFAVLVAVISSNVVARPAYSSGNPSPDPAVLAASPEKFRALSYSIPNSFLMMVHLINPEKEHVKILILNKNKKVVFEKYVGKPAAFVGKLNIKALPNDEYTLVVRSRKHTFSQAFSLQTYSERTLKVNADYTIQVKQKQEAI